jgi:hypothetical protein
VVQIQCFSFGSRGQTTDKALLKDEAEVANSSRLVSMERKRDTTRRCDDVDQKRDDTEKEKGRRRC